MLPLEAWVRDAKGYRTLIGSLAVSSGMIIGLAADMPLAHAQAAPDFTSDVRHALDSAQQSSASDAIAAIKAQDHQTSWDEFGTNALADGAAAPADISKSVTDDIARDLQVQLAYDQKDEQYLRLRQSSPEEILAVEGDGGNDLLPDNDIEPHPSLDANPDVNPTALDMSAASVDTADISVTPDAATAAPEDVPVIPDSLIPPEGEWKPVDVTVFETILNAETPNTETSVEPSPDAVPAPGSEDALPPPDAPVAPAEPPPESPVAPAEAPPDAT